MGMHYVQARVHQQGLVRQTARFHGEAMVTATGTVTMLLVNTMMATAAQEAYFHPCLIQAQVEVEV